ncbi:MAG TPA: sigma-70 family RNA polymerase sigma factor [Eudoraea sp.]|nr:sigma-70 family RNA polymerase sigma factor [Eudoraea sp.]
MKIEAYCAASDLWLEHETGLRGYIFKIVQDCQASDDLTAEVLMKIYNSCCSNQEIKNVKSWIYRIARNVTIDYLRSKKRETNEVPEIVQEEEEEDHLHEAESITLEIIGLLPDIYSIPLRLHDIEGIKTRLIADRLGMSHATIRSRLRRARKLFEQKIMECCLVELDEVGGLIHLELKKACSGTG